MAYDDIVKAVELGHSFIQDFINDDFRVLKCIQEHQEKSGEDTYVSTISQEDVGKILGFSKGKVNASVKTLIEKGYLKKEPRGYSLSGAGNYVCIVLG